jgi:hypothetical protein
MDRLQRHSRRPGRTLELLMGLGLTMGGAVYLWAGTIEREPGRAARLLGSGHLWADAGRKELDRALDGSLPDDARQAHLRQAVDALRAGLALSPLDPYAWADLALSLWLAGAPTAEAAQALERSLATGPAERNLLPLRVRLINAVGPFLSEEGRSLADRERALARRTSSSLRRLLNP